MINLRDVIVFEGDSVEEVEQAFRESVDDYLAFCAERGEEPEKPYSGKSIVGIPPALHREASLQANLPTKVLITGLPTWLITQYIVK